MPQALVDDLAVTHAAMANRLRCAVEARPFKGRDELIAQLRAQTRDVADRLAAARLELINEEVGRPAR